jgi:hypothetical protein
MLIGNAQKQSSYHTFLIQAQEKLDQLQSYDQCSTVQVIQFMLVNSIQILKNSHDQMTADFDWLMFSGTPEYRAGQHGLKPDENIDILGSRRLLWKLLEPELGTHRSVAHI